MFVSENNRNVDVVSRQNLNTQPVLVNNVNTVPLVVNNVSTAPVPVRNFLTEDSQHYCARVNGQSCDLCYLSYNDNGNCVPVDDVIEGCVRYNSLGECRDCIGGYKLNDGLCVQVETELENCIRVAPNG